MLSWGYAALPEGEESRRQVWGLGQANYHEFREKLGARQLPDFTAERFLHGSQVHAAPVEASVASGHLQMPAAVALDGDGPVYYTLDGSIPTRRSARYREPIRIDSSTVLRARVLDGERLPGPVRSWHYLADRSAGLPVLSVASDPVGLWNKYSGIYSNPTGRGRAWEREGQVAYLGGEGADPVRFAAELRVHGGYSRLLPKKSLRLRFADSAVAALPHDHPLRSGFGGSNEVVVRGDGGSPGYRARDAVASALYEELGGLVSRREPVELYLNGRYWGVFDLRERVGETFLPARFGGGTYEHLTHDSERGMHWLNPLVGGMEGWEYTMHQLRTLDLSTDEGLARAAELIDLEGTIDYWVHNVFTANVDWPYNNVNVYRRIDGADHRWKWIAWDLDPTFIHVEHNTLAWSLRDRPRNDLKWNYQRGAFEDREHFIVSTEPLRLLLRNPSFRERFIARIQVLTELYYTEDRVSRLIDDFTNPLLAAYGRDAARWGWPDSAFVESLEWMRKFTRERPAHLRAHLAEQFSLGEPVKVRIDARPGETVYVDRMPLPRGGATLTVLEGTRLHVTRSEGEGLPGAEEVLEAGR